MSRQKFTTSSFKTYMRLLEAVKPYWVIFATGIGATIVVAAMGALIVWAMKPVIDKGLVARNMHFLTWLPLLVIIVFIVRGAASFLSDYCISRVGRSIVMDFRQKVFAHFLHLPASFYDRETSGKLLALLIYNVGQIASAATDALLTIVRQSFSVIGSIVVMFIISWHLTLIFMVAVPIVIFITQLMNRRLRKLSLNVQKSIADVTHIAREGIDGYKVIRTFGGEQYEKDKFNKAARVNRNRELKVVVTNAIGTSAVQIICALPMALIIYIIGVGYLHVSVGGFGAMIAAVLRLLTPIRRLTKVTSTIQKGVAGAESVYEILDQELEKDHGTVTLERAQGKIEYRQVNFAYPKTKRTVLPNVSFTVEPGQIVALVGHSGAGKSTLVNLLPRFYDVTVGEILIDAVNINEYHLMDLRKQFSFVSQHIILFNDTVARNIAYGKYDQVSEADIIKAAKAAHIWEAIEQLPDGLNTVIGEQGLTLSGGQRQRLAIARAIMKDAPILILDEATSALDTQSERFLQASFEELMNKRTTLVIAHRLSTVEKADRIIVLDQGEIIEAGTHKELIQRSGHYAKLYKMQFSE